MRKHNRGQSLVEFALILPVLLVVLFALIDGAFLIQAYLAVNHAASEAARFAVTYQPVQGECLEREFPKGTQLAGYPWCDGPDEGGTQIDVSTEGETGWEDRRVEMIKLVARQAAYGLRIPCPATVANCSTDGPGLFQVRVWGDPGFGAPPIEDYPGLQGTSVFVHVVHHVPLVTPVAFLLSPTPYIRVQASSEMVNEGTFIDGSNTPTPRADGCVGIACYVGDVNVTIEWGATATVVGGGGEDPTPGGSGETSTPVPQYFVELNFESAVNDFPDERSHMVAAQVTNERGRVISGMEVKFRTDKGSFQYSGVGSRTDAAMTAGDGWARTAIYANEPLSALIEAWLDYNDNGILDPGEPLDTATKVFEPTGPYLVVSDHSPEPGEFIGVSVMDHLAADNPHSLWWCPIGGTAVIGRVAHPVNVDVASGDAEDIPIQVPDGALGTYRVESHVGDGGANACGNMTTMRANSGEILVKTIPPDLIISALEITSPAIEDLAASSPMTVKVQIQNTQGVTVTTGPFDVDVYPHLENEPYVGSFSTGKQWVETLGPSASKILTFVVEVAVLGDNKLWAQVDTSNYVDEGTGGGEDNNTFGPVEFSTCARSDDFDAGLKSFWSQQEVGSVYYSDVSVNGAGQLEVTSRSPSGLWGGNQNFFYVYQSFSDDFDARLKLIDKGTTNTWAKIGLHIRESLAPNAAFVMSMITNNQNPAGTQIGYRNYTGSSTDRVIDDDSTSLPYWVRIARKGDDYAFYSSTASEPGPDDWDLKASHTCPTDLGLVGIANAGYNGSENATGVVDDFVLCKGFEGEIGGGDGIKPPGLIQCQELIQIPGFEGNADTVFQYWEAGGTGAFRRSSERFYHGSFSLRLHASLGFYPCTQSILEPYAYQEVELPTEVYPQSTLVLKMNYLVVGSDLECSNPDSPDADDQFFVRLRDQNGSEMGAMPPQLIATGATEPDTWKTSVITVSDYLNLESQAGNRIQLYWDATHDEDYDGTFFYMDEISAQLCTEWAVPELDPSKVSFGGMVTAVTGQGARLPWPGATVWAYTQDGAQYQTVTIQDGTYHFYNLPPGTYVVYAESWVEGRLMTAAFPDLVLAAGDVVDNIDLPLQ